MASESLRSRAVGSRPSLLPAWLASQLQALLLAPGSAPSADDLRLVALPSLAEPRLLVPASSRVAAERMVLASSPRHRRRVRAVRSSAAVLARLGFHVVLARGVVHVDGGPDGLVGLLRERFTWLDTVGVHLGTRRPNQKPILLLADRSGEVRAFTKLGWDVSTRSLVSNEANALRHARARSPIVRPALLDRVVFDDVEAVTMEALPLGQAGIGSLAARDVVRTVRTIAGPAMEVEKLTDSRYLADLLPRVAAGPDANVRSVALATLDRHAERTLRFGEWHGDLTPWNCRRARAAVFVWDWERWSLRAPLGFDLFHYYSRLPEHEAEGERSLLRARSSLEPALGQLGVSPELAAVVQQLHLVELIGRFGSHPSMAGSVAGLARTLEHANGGR